MLSTTRVRVMEGDLAAIADQLRRMARQMPQAVQGMPVILEAADGIAVDLAALLAVVREVGMQPIGVAGEALAAAAQSVGMAVLPADAGESSEGRTAADNATVRSVFVIGPDKKIKAMLVYPMSTGRNFDEVLRLVDSCQLTAQYQVATPVNWKQGDDVIIVPAVSDEQAKEKYPDGWKSPKPYIRIVPQPGASRR